MYDVHRRLQLMRRTKAYVQRKGFGQHCRVISQVTTEHLLRAMALHSNNPDVREVLRDENVDVALKRAIGGVLQATASIMGTEGHRSQIRLRGHAAGWHYGTAHLFVTKLRRDYRRLHSGLELAIGSPRHANGGSHACDRGFGSSVAG